MPSQTINFVMQPQQGDNWCWAANASSISFLYDHNSPWVQCKIVSVVFNNAPSCPPAPGGTWDITGRLDLALRHTQNLVSLNGGATGFGQIQQEIDGTRVVGVQITWPNNGGAHFVTIYGYDDTFGTPFVYVADPKFQVPNANLISLDYLTQGYHQPGSRWTLSYLTQSNFVPLSAPLPQAFAPSHSVVLKAVKKTRIDQERQSKERFSARLPSQRSRLVSHDICYIPFSSILSGSPQLVTVGLRVLHERKVQKYLSEFDGLDSVNAKLVSIVLDQVYVAKYIQIWQQILAKQRALRQRYQLQFVRQPEFGIEAFCIKYGPSFQEIGYVLISTPDLFSQSQDYLSQTSFFEILQTSLKKQKNITDRFQGS